MSISRRIKQLETTNSNEPLVIFRTFFGEQHKPVIGYQFGQKEVRKRDGESTDEVKARAVIEASESAPTDAALILRVVT